MPLFGMPAKKQLHQGRLIDLNIESAILPDGTSLELDIVPVIAEREGWPGF